MANKTQPMTLDPSDYLDAIVDPQRQDDCREIHAIMERLSGETPKIWGNNLKNGMVGFGDYHYVYESGREGDFFRTGYANRSASISVRWVWLRPAYRVRANATTLSRVSSATALRGRRPLFP